jgi:hypothetical protein
MFKYIMTDINKYTSEQQLEYDLRKEMYTKDMKILKYTTVNNLLSCENKRYEKRLKKLESDMKTYQTDISIESDEINSLIHSHITRTGIDKWIFTLVKGTIFKVYENEEKVTAIILEEDYTHILGSEESLKRFISMIQSHVSDVYSIGQCDGNTLFMDLLLLDKLYSLKDADYNSRVNTRTLQLLRFSETMIPSSYFKISKRFPHLSLEQILAFNTRVCKKGGKIMVHSGHCLLMHNNNSGVKFIDKVWTCCPQISDKLDKIFDPDSECCSPKWFYLDDICKKEIRRKKIGDLGTIVNARINNLSDGITKRQEMIKELQLLERQLKMII